ncbi:MAG: cytochrome C oxidase subunit III [Bacteroidetes bacterium]|nr:MAG: cytochrome C oxidase subunit III [Bacteroidota bacterium]
MKNRALSIIALVLACLLGLIQPLQAAEEGATPADASHWSDLLLVVGGVAFFAGLLALWGLYQAVIETAKVRLLQEMGIEAMEKAGLSVDQSSWWQRQYKKWTKVVPVEKEQDIMLDHNYDGIRELDNSLPPWWVAMFYITIAISVVYLGYYHVLDYGYSSTEAYEIEMEEAQAAIKAYLAKQADAVDETNVSLLVDEQDLALGETTFKTYCAACHGQYGEGGVGPNLTDNYFLHGGDIKDVFKTIKYGVPEKGMIAWQTQLRPADIQRVASYVLSLVGTNPPNPKAPQGELYQVNTPVANDSTSVADEALGMVD